MANTRKPIEWTDEDLHNLLADIEADRHVILTQHLDDGSYIGSANYLADEKEPISVRLVWALAWVGIALFTAGWFLAVFELAKWIWGLLP